MTGRQSCIGLRPYRHTGLGLDPRSFHSATGKSILPETEQARSWTVISTSHKHFLRHLHVEMLGILRQPLALYNRDIRPGKGYNVLLCMGNADLTSLLGAE